MKIFYAVFDTNVLVSALMSKRADSPTVLLLDYVLDGRVILLYNEDIVREYKEVLHRSKFDFSEDSIQDLIELVKTGLHINPTASGEIFPDKDDQVFYEVALSKGDGYVVTGNTKHFPKSPIVVTPAEMMQIVQGTNK
jgi:putative PIN family toxin of toxin-antitoxin system